MPTHSQPDYDIEAAHKHCVKNREELERSSVCGCFYCFETFTPCQITVWTDNAQTAIHTCSVDAVIGSASGFPVTSREFLQAMYDRWF